MAWTAVFLMTVLMPLMLLIVDGSRLLYIRGRLQTASDAACEAAAWFAGDRSYYQDTGLIRIENEGKATAMALYTFTSTLLDRDRMSFSAQLSVYFDHTLNNIQCLAVAQVPVLFSTGGIAPQVDIPAETLSTIRFR
jgi:Flp pilus assembly protein TadG